MNVVIGSTVYFDFATTSFATGAATNASAVGAMVYEDNGSAALSGVSVAQISTNTGEYRITVVATAGNGFEIGKSYNVWATATVGGVAGKACIATFLGVDALATTPPTATQIRTEMDANSTKLASLDVGLSAVLAAIAALHDFDPATDTVAHVTLVDTTTTLTNAPDVPTESEIAAAVLAGLIESGFTLKQAIRLILSAQAGKISGANGTTILIRDINDAKNRIVATVDQYGNRSLLIYDTSD